MDEVKSVNILANKDSGRCKLTLLNGSQLSTNDLILSYENSAFFWGQSVFTTGLIQRGKLTFFQAHEDRLNKAYQWVFSRNEKLSLVEILNKLPEHSSILLEELLKIRITLFLNIDKELQILIQVSDHNIVPLISQCSCSEAPILSKQRPGYVKLGSYAETFRVREELNREPIFYDPDENLLEGAVANLLFFDTGRELWVTPKSDYSIVQGLGLSAGLAGVSIVEEKVSRNDLNKFGAAFFVNGLRGPQVIERIDDVGFEDSSNKVDFLQEQFKMNSEKTARILWPMEN